MRKLLVFNHVSLDGYFVDRRGDMSWAHHADPEWQAFTAENANRGGLLLFGRVTYEMMASYWPTPQAAASAPAVAEGINAAPKVVFSRTLERAAWRNTRVLRGDLADEVGQLKREPGDGIVVMGSGTIVAQLARANLVDEYQIIVDPVVLGGGRTLFEGLEDRRPLKLTRSRTFGNGAVLLCYEPGNA